MRIKKEVKLVLAFALMFCVVFVLNAFIVSAEANFRVIAFSCSPSEVVKDSIFSCTATIRNDGTTGTLEQVTLNPDDSGWFESSDVTSGASVGNGESTEVTFNNLKASKAGYNGFSNIMMGNVEDPASYLTSNNIKVNTISAVVSSISNSASSANMNADVVSTTTFSLTGKFNSYSVSFASISGGCSIGSQTNPSTVNQNVQDTTLTKQFTITMGTTGNCRYTMSVSASGTGGVATTSDSTDSSITCLNCPTDSSSSSSSSSGGGAGGGGAGGSTETRLGEINQATSVEMSASQKIKFNISNTVHSLTLVNLTDISAIIAVESEKQTFTLMVGDEKEIDLNDDKANDISIKLKSINVLTKKANFIISKLAGASLIKAEEKAGGSGEKAGEEGKESGRGIQIDEKTKKTIIIVVFVLIGIAIVSLVLYFIMRRKRRRLWGEI